MKRAPVGNYKPYPCHLRSRYPLEFNKEYKLTKSIINYTNMMKSEAYLQGKRRRWEARSLPRAKRAGVEPLSPT